MKIYTKAQRAYNAEKMKEIMKDVNVAELASNVYGLNLYQSREKGNELKCIEHPNITFDVKRNRVYLEDEGKGMSSFDFVQRYENLSFIEAKQKVIDYYHEKNPNELEIYNYNRRTDSVQITNGLVVPKHYENNDIMKSYLMNNYNIKEDVIDEMINHNLLYEDYYHNCVFAGYDTNDDVQFAWKLGTGEKDYQTVVNGSWKKIGWNYQTDGTYDKVIFTDMPINALRYINEHQDEQYCIIASSSLGAIELAAKNYAANHHSDLLKEIILLTPKNDAVEELAKSVQNIFVEEGNLKANVTTTSEVEQNIKDIEQQENNEDIER